MPEPKNPTGEGNQEQQGEDVRQRAQMGDMLNRGRAKDEAPDEEEEEDVDEEELEDDDDSEYDEEDDDLDEDEDDEDEDDDDEDDRPAPRGKQKRQTPREIALEKRLRRLTKQVEALTVGTSQGRKSQEPEEEEEVVALPEFEMPTDEALEEMFTDSKKFAAFMKKVVDYPNQVRKHLLQEIPQLADKTVSRQAAMRQLVDDFYRTNKDLKQYKDIVGMYTNQVASDHPDWNAQKVLNQAAKVTRKKLGLNERAERVESSRRKKRDDVRGPAFARTPRGVGRREREQEQVEEGQGGQIGDMLTYMNKGRQMRGSSRR